MRVVGLTGGIATGKSTVSKLLREQGFPLVDCDVIARDVVRPGRWGYKRVVRAFGTSILKPDGEIDREALGRLVFSDRAARSRLNAATHLPIYAELLRQLLWLWLTFKPVVVVDMPLMIETGSYKYVHLVVVVAASPQLQLSRLQQRNALSPEDAQARMDAQMPIAAKAKLADVLISNEGSLQQLEQQVQQASARLRRRARWWGWLTSPAALAAALVALGRLVGRL